MKCPNCGAIHWENVDSYRYKETDKKGKKINMSLCLDCGMISYPDKWATKEEIFKHYRESYRPAPTIGNLFAGQRKNHFHMAFLEDLFNSWNDSGKTKPVICDIGTAFGMSLALFKQIFPEGLITGTELTTSMKRVAQYEFGLNLTDDIDESLKYDMIMSYKVLEHQLDPLDELLRYKKLLSEDGVLYISVPTWFNTLSNFGLDGFDLEYYYDPNHVNVWTREMFESLLKRAGFDVVKEDHIIYGDTYLCKPSKEDIAYSVYKISPDIMKGKLESAKKAFELYAEYKYKEAIDAWPDYPAAWIAYLEMNRKQLAGIGWLAFEDQFILPMLNTCKNSPEVLIAATDFALRARELDVAIEYANKSLKAKPNNPATLEQLINIYKEIGLMAKTEQEKIEGFKRAREFAVHLSNVSLQSRDSSVNHTYFLDSLLPIEGQ